MARFSERKCAEDDDRARRRVHPPFPDARLPPGFVKIRHFGFLANGARRVGLALCRSLLPGIEPGIPQMLSDRQRRAVERKCPACQAGTLCLIGWIPPGIPIEPTTMNLDSS